MRCFHPTRWRGVHSHIERAVARPCNVHYKSCCRKRVRQRKDTLRVLRRRFFHKEPRTFQGVCHRLQNESVSDCKYDSFHFISFLLCVPYAYFYILHIYFIIGNMRLGSAIRHPFGKFFMLFRKNFCKKKTAAGRRLPASIYLIALSVRFRRRFCQVSQAPILLLLRQVACGNGNPF